MILYRVLLFIAIFNLSGYLSEFHCQINNTKISGTIHDAKTFQPVSYAEIFISNTTLGTTSDKNGNYEINNIPPGKNTIVVSITGYESQSREVYIFSGRERQEDFILKEKVFSLNSVDVVASTPEVWREQLERFKEYFLGLTPNADECEIENEVEINFYEDEKLFTALPPENLEITNTALGYKVNCILKNFIYDKEKKSFSYLVFPRFTDIADQEGTRKWYHQMMRRKGAYFSSLRYVMMQIINNNVDNGVIVLSLWEDPNWPTNVIMDDASEIITYNPITKTYTLRFSEYMKIEIDNKLESMRPSWLYLPKGEAKIDIYGNFINPDEFVIRGDLGRKGLADLLPKYYVIEEE